MSLERLISTRREEVLARCLGTLRTRRPGRTDEELLAGLPTFVDELLAALRDPERAPPEPIELGSEEAKAAASKHGAARKAAGFTLEDVVHDYGLVCDVIGALAVEARTPLDAREVQVMNRLVDGCIAVALTQFRADEQSAHSVQLGSFAHEVRNAVNTASMALRLVRSGQVGIQGKTADVLERCLAQISALVAEALGDAQLSRGARPERVPVRLATFLEQIVESTPRERGIAIRLTSAVDVELEADPRLLTSAVTNLLQNAVKFTRDGETVLVRLSADEGAIAIEVEDRCGGMEGDTERVFQPYVQRRPDARGTGLGLQIARRAVESHGGTLTVRDLPGVGCVFVVRLPEPGR